MNGKAYENLRFLTNVIRNSEKNYIFAIDKEFVIIVNDMESVVIMPEYQNAVQAIKLAILESRYRAARLVNKEVLALYYAVGEYISKQSRTAKWGANAIGTISLLLQQELPGLRGFSETNIKRMRLFYEAWRDLFENRPPVADELAENGVISTDSQGIVIRPLTADELSPDDMNDFLSVGFTHHSEILARAKDLNQRMFYIKQCAVGFWSKEKLIYYLNDGLYEKQGTMPNNFTATISDIDLRQRALRPFKDEYFLDFVNIEDPDEIDEKCLEQQIVHNIKNFIMALGNDFSFIGNQYRLVVEGKEYFIDLLFFNRNLQSLVAIELKTGEFKPEYAGKLNFYLSALDELVKLPHENPSIGIVLCKDKNSRIVEFAFRDITKPMGVATYRTSAELPKEYQGILPDPDELRELM